MILTVTRAVGNTGKWVALGEGVTLKIVPAKVVTRFR